MINCNTSSYFTSLDSPIFHGDSTPFQSLTSGGSGNVLAAPQLLQSSNQGGAANEKPLMESQRQLENPESTSVSSTQLSISTEKLEKQTLEQKSLGQESCDEDSTQESGILRLVIRLPPKNKKSSKEIKDEELKIQNSVQTSPLGASSPDPIASAGKLEKETKRSELGQKEGNQGTRSSRKIFIRLPPRDKKVSEETRVQEEQKIENNDFQEDGKKLSALCDYQMLLPKIEEKKQKKRGFTMALSKEEIEEDIIALIGSNPPKRPKKRLGMVKNELKNLFPGAWLENIDAADD